MAAYKQAKAETKFLFKGKEYACPKTVYYPSEDSYFLAENARIEKNCFAIDVGCGSGIQTLNMLSQGATKVVAIDISEEALHATMENAKKAGFGGKATAIKSGLFKEYKEGKADFIVFNPPYVPSDSIRFADLDGGKRGREVLDEFLEQFPKHLKEKGACYFLQTDINGYARTKKLLSKKGFECEIVARKRGFFEELAIFRCQRAKA